MSMAADETPLRCKYTLIIAAFRDLGELVKKQQASIAELEADRDGLYDECQTYGAANGELRDKLFEAEAALARCEALRDEYHRMLMEGPGTHER